MERRVTTHGTGAAEGAPDAMSLSLAAVAVAPDVGEALEKVALNARAIATIAQETVPGATVASTGLQVWPSSDGSHRGFEARHALRLWCPSVDEAGPLVDVIASAVGDALRVEGIDLVLADPGPLEAQARELAVADARRKAEQYAALAGLRLAEVVQVEENLGGGPGRSYAAKAEMLAATSFEPGTRSVSASVTVTWTAVPL